MVTIEDYDWRLNRSSSCHRAEFALVDIANETTKIERLSQGSPGGVDGNLGISNFNNAPEPSSNSPQRRFM
jgi:hypothetical protein